MEPLLKLVKRITVMILTNRHAMVLCLFIIMTAPVSYAQQSKKDSLLDVLQISKSTEQVVPLTELGIVIAATNLDSSKLCFRAAHRLALRHRDSINIVRTGRLVAEIFRRQYQFDSALYYIDRVLPIRDETISWTHKSTPFKVRRLFLLSRRGMKKHYSRILNP